MANFPLLHTKLSTEMTKLTPNQSADNMVVSLLRKKGEKTKRVPLSFEPSNLQIPLCFPISSVSPFHGRAGKQMKGIIPSLSTFTQQFHFLQSLKNVPDLPVFTYCCPM